MRIGVDILGGDHAPEAILKGCALALADRELLTPSDTLVLFGPRDLIVESLRERGLSTTDRIEIEHCDDAIAMGDSAAKSVRSRESSTIVRMHQFGSPRHERACDAVLSAGNTGACVAAALLHMRRLPHVVRPGIAVTIPSFHGPVVLLDAGANPEAKPEHLWQYGIMGDVFARASLGIAEPRVALMNIGSEEGKGPEIIREARDLLRDTPGMRFTGFVEGRDFFEGAVDVVVTDGLVGNILLKAFEGMAKSLFKAIAAEIIEQDPGMMSRFEPIAKGIYAKNDYHEHGGAPLLGVHGICLISHGSSEARTIKAAIRNAKRYASMGLNAAIERRLTECAGVIKRHPVVVLDA